MTLLCIGVRLRRVGIRFLLLLLFCCTPYVSANADQIVLDQSVIVPHKGFGVGGISSTVSKAQTFTVERPGQLAFASAALFSQDTFPCSVSTIDCSLEVQISRTVLGAPSDDPNDVLATVFVPWHSIPSNNGGYIAPSEDEYTLFDLRRFNIGVSVGDIYAMTFLSDFQNTAFGTFNVLSGVIGEPGTRDPNPGGQQWFRNPGAGISSWAPTNGRSSRYNDTGFQTFIRVPAPGTLTLFGIGLFGMGLARRRIFGLGT